MERLKMMIVSIVLIAVCFWICREKIWLKSKANIEKGIVDNGAQLAVTVGVIFTFIGITIGLLNFDTDSTKMADNINLFLEGMKTAFGTSIIGMIFGIYIKYKQSEVEQKDDITLKKILHENIGNISKELNDIKNSIEANSNATLQREIRNLVTAMNNFIQASNSSREDMKEFSESIKNQVTTVNNLSTALTKNIEKLAEKIVDSNQKQSADFKSSMQNFSESQSAQLDKMLELTEQAKQNSENLLTETKIYQRHSLDNDARQAEILSENTEKISAMKKSFDDFLDNMTKNYSQALIDALRQSIEQLNVQLQDQFGDNFKELNRAVSDVVKWQENYKITVENTTEELQQLNAAFKTFSEKISSQVDKHIESMATNVKIFADTSNKNVGVQKNLNDAVISLSQAVQDSKDSVKEMQKLTQSFGAFSSQVISQNNAAIDSYKNTVEKNLNAVAQTNKEFKDEIKKLQNTALTVRTDTDQNIKEFGDAIQKVMGEIRKTLEKFNTDFSKETTNSLKNLQQVFNQISTNTETQSGKAIETLAGSLSAITDQIIENYNALIKRIAELDALIRKEDDKK